jgi:hypothetical protein
MEKVIVKHSKFDTKETEIKTENISVPSSPSVFTKFFLKYHQLQSLLSVFLKK